MLGPVPQQQLSEVQFDQYGTPDRKLPDCPLCGKDELYAHPLRSSGHGFKCYVCSYSFAVEHARAPEPPPEVDVAELVRLALNDALLRELVFSTLVNRAGGSLTLTREQVRRGHGEPVQVHIDPTTRDITLTTEPCAHCAKGFPLPVGHA
jgi:hypothetical protein